MKINNERFLYKAYKKMFRRGKLAKQLLLWYSLITIIGAFLLFIPLSKTDGASTDFIDYLFVSASAFSDTGLTTLTISETFTFFGQFIIFSLIILGGIGFFSLKLFIFRFLFYRTITEKNKDQAEQEMGYSLNYYAADIVKVATISVITIVLVFGTIFGILFATVEAKPAPGLESVETLQGDWGHAMWTGYFHAASSVNNAGFDIFYGNTSMAVYYGNFGIQFLTLILFVFGGIGFAVIYDLKVYLTKTYQKKRHRFSLFTKISVSTYFVVAFLGLSLVFFTEGINYAIDGSSSFYGNDDYGTAGQKTWAIIFNTFSTRNAGFSTINIADLSTGTQVVYTFMMFIGSGPGSTAGGIRTTTTFVVFMYFVNKARRRNTIVVFNRQIDELTVKTARNIFVLATILVLLTSVFVAMDQIWINGDDSLNYVDALFVSASAFGTVGLSTFDLSTLDPFAELWLILIMFIGQAGAINILNMINVNLTSKTNTLTRKDHKLHKTIYLKEKLFLG